MSGQYNQIVDDAARLKIGSVVREQLDNQMTLINDKLDYPLDVTLSGDVITIEAGTKQKLESNSADGTQSAYKWRLPLMSGLNVNPAQSTLNLTDGSFTGDFNTPVGPTMTAGFYVQMGIELRKTGQLYVVFGTQAASAGATTPPPMTTGVQILIVTLHDSGGGGAWNYVTPVKSDIQKIAVGGSGGGAGLETFTSVALANARLSSQANDLIWVVATETMYQYQASSAIVIDSTYVLADTSTAGARWQGVAGKYVYQGEGLLRTFASVANLNAETNNFDNKLAYCVATKTIYQYFVTNSATVDSTFVVADTANAGNKWLGVSGQYVYQQQGLVRTVADIAALNAVINSAANQLIYVVSTQTTYQYFVTNSSTVDSLYVVADTSQAGNRWIGIDGQYIFQYQGLMRTFVSVANVNAETSNFANKLIYCVATDTVYKYVPTAMSAVAVDSLYMLADTANASARWQGVCGKYIYLNFNQNSYVAKTTNIVTASAGSFATGHSGTPLIQAWLWDNALSTYQMIDPSSYLVNVNSGGTSVDYDFTGATLGGSDFIKLMVIYHDLVANLSNEFDSGWIDKAVINNLPSAGWHRMDLPAGFTAYPAGYTLTFNNGTEIRPGELPDRVVFDLSTGTYRIAVYVNDLVNGNLFRVTASVAARPTGNLSALEQQTIVATGTMAQPSGNVMAVAAITAPATTTLPAASTMTGFKIFLKNPTAFAWTISSGQNIDGAGSIVLGGSNNESTILISTGTTYLRFG